MHYSFVRIHKTLKMTPAMAANVTPKLWEMADMVRCRHAWDRAAHLRVLVWHQPEREYIRPTKLCSSAIQPQKSL